MLKRPAKTQVNLLTSPLKPTVEPADRFFNVFAGRGYFLYRRSDAADK